MPNFKLKQQFYELTWLHATEGATRRLKYLDEAKTWYNQTRTQVEPIVDEAEQKRSQLEEKIGDAGTASLERERPTDLERVAAISS